MTNRAVWGVALLLFVGAVVSAQTPTPTPQKTPVFRGGTTVVPLMVTVVDQKGAPVTDLKQSDFRVYEDRSLREIVNFFPQAFVPGGPEGDGLGPRTHRTFVLVLGSDRFQNVFHAIDRTIAFLREQLAPQDAIALMAFHRTTPFTTDHEAVARVLERYKKEHDRVVNDLWESWIVTTPALFGSRKPDDPRVLAAQSKVQADIDAMLGGIGPLRDTSSLVAGMDGAAQVADRPPPWEETLQDVVNRLGGASLTGLVADSNRFKLFAGVELLRYLDGEKHLVFVAASKGLAREDDDHDVQTVARRATDAHVIVDMIGNTEDLGKFSWASREVAELTGGYYSTLDYADKALAKIDQRSRFSYLLGYDPVNPMLDGRFREVEVKVDRPGVVVRFAHGYYARAEPDPIDLKALILKSRLEAALDYSANATDITLGVTAYMLPRMGIQAEARVQVTIDVSHLGFESKNGLRTGQLELQVYCGDAKEAIIGEFGERLELEANDDTYAQWLQGGIRRTVRVPVVGTPKFVKVIVYDYASDRVGSFILTLKEP